MASIPLSWNDPLFSDNASSGSVTLKDGGTLSNKSITTTGDLASVVGSGSFTLDDVRINSGEGVRIGGSGDIVINNSYIETTGQSGDHADGIQAYDPGGTGNVTITNSAIVSHNNNATAGMFIADSYSGTFTFNNVMFEGGPFGLRIAADAKDIYVSLTDVYFVGPFMYDALLFQEVNAHIHITHWENVRYATIVNGELIPGALIAPPLPVEGGVTPPASPTVPTIVSFSDDSGIAGDHITNDNTVTLAGKAAASSTIKVFDGAKQVGTATADAKGAWSFTSAALTDGNHSLTATATSGGVTSSASAALSLVIDTKAPVAPTVSMSTSASTLASTKVAQLAGTAEANSTVTVFDGATKIGTVTANGSGAWTFTTAALATGSHSFTAKAMDAAGNTGVASTALGVTVSASTPNAPNAPAIVSFSNDSGVAGDGITNDNTLTLTGTAAANSTVKVYDGATQIGTTTANASGSWSYITSVLNDAKHLLTATATNGTGQTSAASTTLAVTIDTTAPGAPTIDGSTASGVQAVAARSASSSSTANSNVVNLTGTAEAKSSIDIYDGAKKIGTATAAADGTWNFTTDALAAGHHTFTAKATDVAGNVGKTSTVLDIDITAPAPTPTKAPSIVSFSNDTGKAGDNITSDSTLTLKGTGDANSTIKVFDGTKTLGTVKTDANGAWSYTTAVLADGAHNLTAKAVDASGKVGSTSAALALTIDTHAPNAPTLGIYSSDGKALSGSTVVDDFLLKGTAEANSVIKVFDAGKHIGSVTTKSDGTWSFDTGHVSDGSHSFTSTAMDVAGNTSGASASKGISVIDTPTSTSSVDLTDIFQGWHNSVIIKGTADAYSQIKIYDGSKTIGTVTADKDGDWAYASWSALSNAVHTFTAKEAGQSGSSSADSGSAIVGSYGSNTLIGTSGDDLFIGRGHPDTFVFATNFGNDVIKDFRASGSGHDVIQFSKSVFDNFADVLSHATQSGQDVVISAGQHDSLTLKNTKLAALDKFDFHFA